MLQDEPQPDDVAAHDGLLLVGGYCLERLVRKAVNVRGLW